MEDKKLFADIEKYCDFTGYEPKKDENDDLFRVENQIQRWKGYPYVENEKLRETLELKEKDERVRVFDQKNNLLLVHYIEPEKSVEQCRGLVYEITPEGCNLKAKSFPYTPEYILNLAEPESIENLKQIILDFKPVSGVVAHEGTIIRIFYANGEWQFSTHKKIDGRKSRWIGKPFGEVFNTLMPQFTTDNLNKDYCYVLLIEDKNTNLVCNDIEGSIYHTVTYDMNTGEIVKPLNTVGLLAEKVDISTVENIFVRVDKVNPRKECGVLLKNEKGEFIKVLNKTYYLCRTFRNNEPSVVIKYLQLQAYSMTNHLRVLMPDYIEKFDEVDRLLPLIPEFLGHLWYYRDYKKNYYMIDQKCYETMRSAGIFTEIFNYTKNTEDFKLEHVKRIFEVQSRVIQNARYLNNILKLIKKDYETFHKLQPEWSELFQ